MRLWVVLLFAGCAGTVGTGDDQQTSETSAALGADTDGDGFFDEVDNCTKIFNPDQRDVDEDGYGSVCDADFDNDGIVGTSDWMMLARRYGARLGDPMYSPVVDMNGDGVIGIPEYLELLRKWGKKPGPSGLSCAGTVPCRPCVPGPTLYVNGAAAVSGSGNCWGAPMKNLQEALTLAESRGNVSQIWIAAGTYTGAFVLPAGVSLYGSFAGNETDPAARQFRQQDGTVLSGDLAGNDEVSCPPNGQTTYCARFNTEENALHVVQINGGAHTLNGLSIVGGDARTVFVDDTTMLPLSNVGGGLLVNGAQVEISGLTLRENRASSTGGAIHVVSGTLTARYLSIIHNTSQRGAVSIGANSTATVSNALFLGNFASSTGGALSGHSSSQITVQMSDFEENRANTAGGALSSDGMVSISSSGFSRNISAGRGGAMLFAAGEIVDSYFRSNQAREAGAIYKNTGSGGLVRGCKFELNSTTAADTDSGYGHGGAIRLDTSTSAGLTVESSTFDQNSARSGGAISQSRGVLVVRGSTFTRNRSTSNFGVAGGGAIHGVPGITGSMEIWHSRFIGNDAVGHGGAFYNRQGSPKIYNSVFLGNHASVGGATATLETSSLVMAHCAVVGNTADVVTSWGGIAITRSDAGIQSGLDPTIVHTIAWGNTLTNGAPGASIYNRFHIHNSWVDLDPGFVLAPTSGADGVWGTDDDVGDLHAAAGAPTVGAGAWVYVPAELTTDLDGNPRVVDNVDIGPYER